MKEAIKEKLNLRDFTAKELLRELAKQAAFMLCGFLLSRGAVFGAVLPFAASFVSAVAPDYLAMSAFGCILGFISPAVSGANSFRYVAGIFAIVAIKALLSALTKYAQRPLIAGLMAGIVTCATGLVSAVGDSKGMLLAVSEAALSFAGAYFFSKAFRALPSSASGLPPEDTACVAFSVNMLLIGTMSIAPGNISLGKVLAVVFILLSSRFGQTAAGAVSGIASGFAVALSGGGLASALALTLSGAAAGIFAPLGKYAQVCALILSNLIASAVGQSLTETVEMLIVSLFGSAIFLIFPRSIALTIGKVFSPKAKTVSENTMKKAVTMRLNFASSALRDVSRTVDTVAKELSRINSPDFDGVLHGIEGEACSGCSLRVNCWEAKKSDTVSAVLEMIKAVREGENDIVAASPEDFKGRCLRPSRVGQAVLTHYSDYASRMAAESRISDVRNVVSEQFDGISDMLSSLAEEFERDEAFDERAAARISAALKNIELPPCECGCRIDKFGRMTVEIVLQKQRGMKLGRMKLLRQVELCCEREFEPPTVTDSGSKLYITLVERTSISVSAGVCQLAASPSGISGDAYSIFTDPMGKSVLVLSDGMGCGGRAAVDGAMATGLITRLLKAGFGYDCALSILNSAMLFKSTDESLATVDIAAIDLFSGRTSLLKAGAAPTVVRRGGKCGIAQSTSLPAGILREVGFDKATVKLRAGDIIVMLSDGAVTDGVDWICAELEAWRDKGAEELAEHLAYAAKRRRTDNHADDITVIAAIVEKAV